MQPKQKKNNIIKSVLDTKVQNLEPNFYNQIFSKLLLREDITSITKCCNIVYKNILNLPGCGKGSKNYWLSRGWDNINAEVKAKMHMKKINQKVKRHSPYSLAFWLKKINPNTGIFYTKEEAEYERNSRRPIRKEYWIARGHTIEDSINLAKNHKEHNNKKGAKGSKSRSSDRIRAHSHRTVEYWMLRGFTLEQAINKVSHAQTLFSKDICIEKYGETEGLRVWGDRQIKWLSQLKKSGLHGGFSKISLELFDQLTKLHSNLHYGENETIIKIDNMSYSIDCVDLNSKKIIEFYGDYWHANPDKFNASHKIKKKTAESIWLHDDIKNKNLSNAGYKILIVWESEYLKNKQGIIDKCITFLNT